MGNNLKIGDGAQDLKLEDFSRYMSPSRKGLNESSGVIATVMALAKLVLDGMRLYKDRIACCLWRHPGEWLNNTKLTAILRSHVEGPIGNEQPSEKQLREISALFRELIERNKTLLSQKPEALQRFEKEQAAIEEAAAKVFETIRLKLVRLAGQHSSSNPKERVETLLKTFYDYLRNGGPLVAGYGGLSETDPERVALENCEDAPAFKKCLLRLRNPWEGQRPRTVLELCNQHIDAAVNSIESVRTAFQELSDFVNNSSIELGEALVGKIDIKSQNPFSDLLLLEEHLEQLKKQRQTTEATIGRTDQVLEKIKNVINAFGELSHGDLRGNFNRSGLTVAAGSDLGEHLRKVEELDKDSLTGITQLKGMVECLTTLVPQAHRDDQNARIKQIQSLLSSLFKCINLGKDGYEKARAEKENKLFQNTKSIIEENCDRIREICRVLGIESEAGISVIEGKGFDSWEGLEKLHKAVRGINEVVEKNYRDQIQSFSQIT